MCVCVCVRLCHLHQPFKATTQSWLYMFMARRLLAVGLIVLIDSWEVLVGLAAGAEIVWTVLREYRRCVAMGAVRLQQTRSWLIPVSVLLLCKGLSRRLHSVTRTAC